MKKIETNICIEANLETVWRVLTDFKSYPGWNPFIPLIAGEKKLGGRLTVSIKPPGSSGMSFKPVILKLAPNTEFRWKGKFGMKGLFDGEHYFILQDKGQNVTNFIHGEIFSGILVWIMRNTLNKTEVGFNMMNRAIKEQCELPKYQSLLKNL